MFQKFDGKKNRLELIEPEFIEGLGRILSFGADKYEAHNWKKASSDEDQDRIYGALQRHLLAYKKGEKLDTETGESHLYHACCNLMFLDYQDRQAERETVLSCAGQVSYPDKIDFVENYRMNEMVHGKEYEFPDSKTEITNDIDANLVRHGYPWGLIGYDNGGFAVIKSRNDGHIILAENFNAFVESEKQYVDNKIETTTDKIARILEGSILVYKGINSDGQYTIEDPRTNSHSFVHFDKLTELENWVKAQWDAEYQDHPTMDPN